jgi:drug/metabolite transporter (DMT)-like permease
MLGRASIRPVPSAGVLMCLASAVGFGAMGVFGKLAYEEGATVGTLLAFRFVLAAALFWAIAARTGALRRLGALTRRDVAIALALGAAGYSAQAGAYFAALERLDASLLALLVYTFPAMVTVAAIVLGRERASVRTGGALLLASAGIVLVLAGAGAGALDPLGTALGLTAAVVYSTYILASEGVAGRVGPLLLSALVCTGAAATLTLGGGALGAVDPGAVSAEGFVWLTGIAVVSTVAAIALFFAGLRRVGPTTASIVSTAEPVATATLAFLAFGEALSAVQLAGGALVIGAVLLLSARGRSRPVAPDAAATAAAPRSARSGRPRALSCSVRIGGRARAVPRCGASRPYAKSSMRPSLSHTLKVRLPVSGIPALRAASRPGASRVGRASAAPRRRKRGSVATSPGRA